MLLALHAGRAAKRHDGVLSGADADAAAVAATLRMLRSIFGEAAVPEPTQSMTTRWEDEPFSRGVYSHVAVGASSADYDVMAEPLVKI
jgi:monoamine oxidase|tara:strand:+ start:310 stop:573 length:264 start_codon:yes stop_codon:yes gene_type:complete